MVTAVDATKHDSCDRYFNPLYQAVEIVMQRVYGESDLHRNAFVHNGYIRKWNEYLKDVAEGRWIDAIFGISALLSVTTQLNNSRSLGKLCPQHGVPLLRLAQAAASNIAIYMVEDALLHLASLKRKEKTIKSSELIESITNDSQNLINSYWLVVSQACDVVRDKSMDYQVEMVFAQYRFRELITKQWKERAAA